MIPHDLRALYETCGQAHVFQYADKGLLSAEEVHGLVAQLRGIDPARINRIYEEATQGAQPTGDEGIEPDDSTVPLSVTAPEDVAAWRQRGLAAVAAGQVAAVVLAGGQGTRLGFDGPKGEYDIGLPSHKSLFQLQAERLRRLQVLAAAGATAAAKLPPIPWYVMTSPQNDPETRRYFAAKGYFGLSESDVFFFAQGTLPCLSEDGKLLLESKNRVAEAPDGNGGLFGALAASGALADMRKRGVEYIHVVSVDNALVRPADPVFVGFCLAENAPCGNKCVAKASPGERVGIMARRGGRPCVVEYTELPQELRGRRVGEGSGSSESGGGGGRLVFGAANICNHLFSRSFVEDVVLPAATGLYHSARKKIPCVVPDERSGAPVAVSPTSPNGIKLESFVFDVFPLASKLAVLEASREDEFAPVKNAPGSTDGDSPDTARALLGAQACRWAEAAGAVLIGDKGGDESLCEISPLISYAGEGLEDRVGGRELRLPFCIDVEE